jgi:MFS family permease
MLLFYTADYPVTYLVVGGLGILPLLMVLRLPGDPRPATRGSTLGARSGTFWAGIREVIGNGPVLIASGLEAVLYVGLGAFLGFFPTYARGIGLNDAQIGLEMGAQLATTMAAKPLSRKISDQIGRKPMILGGLLLCAVTLPLIPLTSALGVLFPLSALFGLGVAIVTPSTTALVADLVRAGRMGSAMGVFGTIWDSGEAFGPIAAGFLIASLAYSPAFATIAAFMALVALIFPATVRDPTATEVSR